MRKARIEAGMTQADIESVLGLPRGHIGHIEAGRRLPSAGLVALLAGALGLSTDDLLPPQRPKRRRTHS